MAVKQSNIGRNLLLTIAGALIVVPVAGYLGRTAAEAQNYSDQQGGVSQITPPMSDDVKTMVSRQDARGVTEKDFSPEFLKNLESWISTRTSANAKKHWDKANVPENLRRVSAEGVYVSAGSHKFAVVRTRVNGVTPSAVVLGIIGTEAVRVMCLVDNGQNVTLSSGSCDDKIRETFGVSINPTRNAAEVLR